MLLRNAIRVATAVIAAAAAVIHVIAAAATSVLVLSWWETGLVTPLVEAGCLQLRLQKPSYLVGRGRQSVTELLVTLHIAQRNEQNEKMLKQT